MDMARNVTGVQGSSYRRIVVCARFMPRSPIMLTKSPQLSLKLKYLRTHNITISASK